jgi:hypothetical protein
MHIDPQDIERVRATLLERLGPEAIDQQVKHTIHLLAISLPKEQRTTPHLRARLIELFDRLVEQVDLTL